MSSKPQPQESYQDKSKVATHPTKTHTTPNTQSTDTKNRETGKKERPDTHTSPENHRKSEPHKRTSRNPILGRPTDSRLPLRRTVAMTPDRTYGTNPALNTLRIIFTTQPHNLYCLPPQMRPTLSPTNNLNHAKDSDHQDQQNCRPRIEHAIQKTPPQ